MVYKSRGPVSSMFARGGPEITTKSRFLKTPNSATTGIQKNDFDKVGKGGSMAKLSGETKAETPVKPRT